MNPQSAVSEQPGRADDAGRPPVVITLVHGTILFARWRLGSRNTESGKRVDASRRSARVGAAKKIAEVEWYREGSQFRKRLQKSMEIPCTVTEFVWSGANSEWERLCAAGAEREFYEKAPKRRASSAKTLREHLASYPGADHVLIAHSHGGNVCLAALHDPEVRRAVKALVCLSTPFINVRSRGDSETLQKFLIWAGRLILIGLFFWSTYLIKKMVPKPWDSVVWTAGFLGPVFLWAFYAAFTEDRRKALRNWAFAKRRAFTAPPILALLSDGDEALLALKIAEGLNGVLRALWRLAVQIPLRIFALQNRAGRNPWLSVPVFGGLTVVFLGWLLTHDVTSPLQTHDWSPWIVFKFILAALILSSGLILSWCLVLALPGLVAAAVGFVGLACIRWLAFGWAGYMGMEMTAETCPIGSATMIRLGPHRSARGLRHGHSYHDRRAPIHIARFIRKTLASH